MSIWFLINLFILFFAGWKITIGYHGFHMIVGGIGLFLIIYNWTRHAVFSTIRSGKIPRKRKIFFANISKRALPIHKWTGSAALIIIIFHFILVYSWMGFHPFYPKMMSGFIACTLLAAVVLTGWLRWYRTTVRRRYLHWTLVYLLIFSVITHLIL